MLLYVRCQDNSHDVIDAPTLDRLILGKTLRKFYRRSGERWVDVYHDPIRGIDGDYSRPNRRQSHYEKAR